jgi:hypothetical protein
MKIFVAALTIIAGTAVAQEQANERSECLSIPGCNSAQSCKDNLPKIEACIVHLQSINELCKTADYGVVCWRNRALSRQSALNTLNYHLPKYPEYIAYYEKVEQERAEEQARKDAIRKAEEEKREAERNVWLAQEEKRRAKEAAARAEASRKEKQRLASCIKISPYVGMPESMLLNHCNRPRWVGSTDYGSVKFTHYRLYDSGNASVTVRNGVVAIVSYH